MPNRIDANINGIRPSLAVREDRRQANNQAQEPQQAAQQTDRVDISEQARLRTEQARPRAGTAQANPRRAALNAPSAKPSEAGEQGAVNGTTAARAEELRARQDAAARESAERPPERPGNLVDVVG